MAYDKVVDSSALDSKLTAIANAIRAKTGGTANLTLDQMPTEISGIETGTEIPDGYIIPSGSVTITENGTHDVTEKATAIVAVPEPAITLQNKEITENGTYFADAGYDGLGQVVVNVASSGGGSEESQIDAMLDGTITEISSNVTTVVDYACYGLKSLASVNFPNATRLGANSFYNCSALASVNAPKATYLSSNTFRNCTGLQRVSMPLLNSVPTYSFNGCSGLVVADFPKAGSIAANSLNSTTSLKALILRKTNAIATLANVNAFTSSSVANGTGYVYVPRALVDSYKTASNWSTYASQFRALEDYTVDGTTTGALDESKI